MVFYKVTILHHANGCSDKKTRHSNTVEPPIASIKIDVANAGLKVWFFES